MSERGGSGVRSSLLVNFVSLGSVLLIQVLSVPVLIGVLGVAAYGQYLVLVAAPAYLALSDLGLVAAGSTALTVSRVQDDGRAPAILSAIWSGVACVSGAMTLLAGLVLAFVDISSDHFGAGEARLIVLLYVAYVATLLVSSVFEAVHRAVGLFVQSTLLVAAGRVVDFAVGTVVVLITGSPVWMVCGFLVARLGWLLMMRARLRSSAPWATFFPLRLDRAELALLVRPAGASLALPVGNALLAQGFVLVVGAVLGPVAVVVLTTARTVVNFYRQAVNAVSNGLLPVMTRALAAGDRQRAVGLVRSASRALGAVGIPVIVGVTLFGQDVVGLWSGGVRPPVLLMTLLACSVVLDGVWLIRANLQISENLHGRIAVRYLIGSVASVVGLWWAATVWDDVTVAGALICAQSLLMVIGASWSRTPTPAPSATPSAVLV